MERCIYYKNEKKLTYIEQEHVITAGIGGMQKLKKGYVSDKANKEFSVIEMEILRESHVHLIRLFSGIGKRGSRSENKATKSKVQVMEEVDGDYILGYMKGKKPTMIPQVRIISDKEFGFSFPPELGEIANQRTNFINSLARLTKENYSHIKLVEDETVKIIGVYKNRIYTTCTNNEVKNIIDKICEAKVLSESEVQKKEHSTKFKLPLYIDNVKYEKWIGKIAFNTFAYLYGHELALALRDEFDEFRNSIIEDGDSKYIVKCSSESEIHHNEILGVNKTCHNIFISKSGENIAVKVNLFGTLLPSYLVVLSERFSDTLHPNGFVCDWENRKEYTLSEVLKNLK